MTRTMVALGVVILWILPFVPVKWVVRRMKSDSHTGCWPWPGAWTCSCVGQLWAESKNINVKLWQDWKERYRKVIFISAWHLCLALSYINSWEKIEAVIFLARNSNSFCDRDEWTNGVQIYFLVLCNYSFQSYFIIVKYSSWIMYILISICLICVGIWLYMWMWVHVYTLGFY